MRYAMGFELTDTLYGVCTMGLELTDIGKTIANCPKIPQSLPIKCVLCTNTPRPDVKELSKQKADLHLGYYSSQRQGAITIFVKGGANPVLPNPMFWKLEPSCRRNPCANNGVSFSGALLLHVSQTCLHACVSTTMWTTMSSLAGPTSPPWAPPDPMAAIGALGSMFCMDVSCLLSPRP